MKIKIKLTSKNIKISLYIISHMRLIASLILGLIIDK